MGVDNISPSKIFKNQAFSCFILELGAGKIPQKND
jgi:hypothetical protein